MHTNLGRIVLTAPIVLWSMAAVAQGLPIREGTCVRTKIARLMHRLQDENGSFVPDSGSAVSFANGGYQVSYDELPAVPSLAQRGPRADLLDSDSARLPAGRRTWPCVYQY